MQKETWDEIKLGMGTALTVLTWTTAAMIAAVGIFLACLL